MMLGQTIAGTAPDLLDWMGAFQYAVKNFNVLGRSEEENVEIEIITVRLGGTPYLPKVRWIYSVVEVGPVLPPVLPTLHQNRAHFELSLSQIGNGSSLWIHCRPIKYGW
ncbi:MAG TPA: hypothetical protein VGI16_11225 [Candidatus Acidoferrum sp.]|jgi:hypothetical protein